MALSSLAMPISFAGVIGLAVLGGVVVGSASAAFADVPLGHAWVRVGDPGNPPHASTGRGAVAKVFLMGRGEITNAQYAQFLNAVAAGADPYGLWHRDQMEGPMGFIRRQGEPGAFVYTVEPGRENLPVVYVSWFAAARFCNWLHYGQPSGPATVDRPTTEGDAARGAYDTENFPQGPESPGDVTLLPATHHPDARYWLPTLDQWIKAGFYEPESGGSYWQYATRSDAVPRAEAPPGGTSSANYYDRDWAVAYPHLTPIGSYARSASAYGTYDQAGNVMEWLETSLSGGIKRRFAGGAAARYATMLTIDYGDWEDPDHRLMVVGFRVARRADDSGPEPVPVVAPTVVAPPPAKAGASVAHAPHFQSGLDDFVRVDAPGNPADPVHGRGAVGHVYEIARYEVTNADYAAFLNAVARRDDPYRLYEPSMGDGLLGGVLRTATAVEFTYAPKPGWGARPATYLNWYRVARLANWMHFGRPDIGASELGTTEGDATVGAYDTTRFPMPDDDEVRRDMLPARRNPGARYFLPTEDEWFKAAYFDPTREGDRPYWDYPIRSDEAPNNVYPPGDARSVNYVVDHFCVGMPFVLTPVGAFPAARSYFGTHDQGGNVWEWTESWRVPKGPADWRANESTRVLRGGSATYTYIGVSAANADPGHPNHGLCVYGARLARRPNEQTR